MNKVDKKNGAVIKSNTNVLDTYAEILVDGKKYLVERHFAGSRDIKQAVFTVVENEVKRKSA